MTPQPTIEQLILLRHGTVTRAQAERILVLLRAHLTGPCHLSPDVLDHPLPKLPGRGGQLDARAMLQLFERIAIPPGSALIGITDYDIGLPIFTFIFGLANMGGRAALVSTARLPPEYYGLPPDYELAAERTVKEILHEVGHLAGLKHCPDYRCIMSFAASVERVDLRHGGFCSDCEQQLPAALRPPPPREPAAVP